MELIQSNVLFDEGKHTYTDPDGKRYSGITSLIHSILRLGVYPDADEWVQQIAIPRAGYYGSCVHKAIQLYDTLGMKETMFPSIEHKPKDFDPVTFPAHDVSAELEAYIGIKGEAKTVASEFTVSYGDYASQIDSIWEDDGIYLVDFKTNNLEFYPGGEDGLKQYLSWQLSCYKFMYEQQTGEKVKGLKAVHIRQGEALLWDIEAQPDEQVKALLETECIPSDNGFTYFNPAMQVEDAVVIADSASLAVPFEVTKAIADLLQAEQKAKEMKVRLRELMEANGIKKWECDEFTATIAKDSTTDKFDQAAFKKDNPELYAQYTTKEIRKGAFRIKQK